MTRSTLLARAGAVAVGVLTIAGGAALTAAPAHAAGFYTVAITHTCSYQSSGIAPFQSVESIGIDATDNCQIALDGKARQLQAIYAAEPGTISVTYNCEGGLVNSAVISGNGTAGIFTVEAFGTQDCTYFINEE